MKYLKTLVKVASVLAVMHAQVSLASTSIVQNGDFSSVDPVNNYPTDWTVVTAPTGSLIASFDNSTSFSGVVSDDEIYQVLNTVAGQSYNINFTVAIGIDNVLGPSAIVNDFSGSFDSQSFLQVVNGTAGTTSYNFTEVASTDQTTLAFFGYNKSDHTVLSDLSVSVSPVPEPSSFALAGIGLAACFFMTRRKQFSI